MTPAFSLSAAPSVHPAEAPALPEGLQLVALTQEMVEHILPIENVAFSHPWTPGNFADALRSGYEARVLVQGETVLGYFLAMQILDEVHLLNITVSPLYQKQGLGLRLLDQLQHWSRHTVKAKWLWLEVRESNSRARQLYERYGFSQVGARKKYYPVHHGERETAILMSMPLWP
jgi:[ribosomal protein S18]-alanine N-acetyltransferase